jgi:signal transduction histidine kinase
MEAVATIEHEAKNKGLALQIDLDESIYMHTDKKRLFQCVLNYLSNAVKFTEHGKITVVTRRDGETVEISVSDTGPGISQEDMDQLFKSFTRLGNAVMKSKPGTGLGLYLTKRLAEDILQGSVDVESRPGRGSKFMLRVPAKIVQPPYEIKGRIYHEEGAGNRRR